MRDLKGMGENNAAYNRKLHLHRLMLLLFASYWSLLNFRMSIVAFPLELINSMNNCELLSLFECAAVIIQPTSKDHYGSGNSRTCGIVS